MFESSKDSIKRANFHIDDFLSQTSKFFNSQPFESISDTDTSGHEIIRLKLIKPLPAALPWIVADAVNNLRFALDQAVYAIAPNSDTAFPFGHSEKAFKKAIERCCKGIPPEVVELLHNFKPFKEGDKLLWALNKLCNANKHRSIGLVAIASGEISLDRTFQDFAMIKSPSWDRSENEMILRSKINMSSRIEIIFDIANDETEFLDGRSVSQTLLYFEGLVGEIVIAIENEAL